MTYPVKLVSLKMTYPIKLASGRAGGRLLQLVHRHLQMDAALPEGAVLRRAQDGDGGFEGEVGGRTALLHPHPRGRGHLDAGKEWFTCLK